VTQRWWADQSTSSHSERPSGPYVPTSAIAADYPSGRVRIGLDIDSTLHPYWKQFASCARKRFGVDLPYDLQVTWEIPELRDEQVRACIADTHSDKLILAAEPYPGAVETVRAWHEAGHEIHVVSHRHAGSRDATARWLERIGLAHDELDVSHDKISYAREAALELLIDDSPVNLSAALDAGLRAATLRHPWNRELCEEETDVVCAADWFELARALAPLLDAGAPV
jgi:beta-phosphoglucomutase-like phosphatase (HAD superfamily)